MFQFSGDVWQKDPNTEIACIFLSLISKLYKKKPSNYTLLIPIYA